MTTTFKYTQKHSYKYFTDNFTGSIVKRMNRWSYAVGNSIDILLFEIIKLIITFVVVLWVMMIQDILLWVVYLFRIFIFVAIASIFSIRKYKDEILANEYDTKVTWVLSDTITNNINISTFASLKRESVFFWLYCKFVAKIQ